MQQTSPNNPETLFKLAKSQLNVEIDNDLCNSDISVSLAMLLVRNLSKSNINLPTNLPSVKNNTSSSISQDYIEPLTNLSKAISLITTQETNEIRLKPHCLIALYAIKSMAEYLANPKIAFNKDDHERLLDSIFNFLASLENYNDIDFKIEIIEYLTTVIDSYLMASYNQQMNILFLISRLTASEKKVHELLLYALDVLQSRILLGSTNNGNKKSIISEIIAKKADLYAEMISKINTNWPSESLSKFLKTHFIKSLEDLLNNDIIDYADMQDQLNKISNISILPTIINYRIKLLNELIANINAEFAKANFERFFTRYCEILSQISSTVDNKEISETQCTNQLLSALNNTLLSLYWLLPSISILEKHQKTKELWVKETQEQQFPDAIKKNVDNFFKMVSTDIILKFYFENVMNIGEGNTDIIFNHLAQSINFPMETCNSKYLLITLLKYYAEYFTNFALKISEKNQGQSNYLYVLIIENLIPRIYGIDCSNHKDMYFKHLKLNLFTQLSEINGNLQDELNKYLIYINNIMKSEQIFLIYLRLEEKSLDLFLKNQTNTQRSTNFPEKSLPLLQDIAKILDPVWAEEIRIIKRLIEQINPNPLNLSANRHVIRMLDRQKLITAYRRIANIQNTVISTISLEEAQTEKHRKSIVIQRDTKGICPETPTSSVPNSPPSTTSTTSLINPFSIFTTPASSPPNEIKPNILTSTNSSPVQKHLDSTHTLESPRRKQL